MDATVDERAARDSPHGLALGDAFGQTWFRLTAGEAERRLVGREDPAGPWPWTDDTAMALSLFQILVTAGTVRQDDLARSFVGAYAADRYRGYGGSMHDVLRCIGAGEHWQAVATRQFGGMGSWGTAPRCARRRLARGSPPTWPWSRSRRRCPPP